MYILCKHVVFIVFFITNISLFGQVSNIGFERYSLEAGLSHSTVYCIEQDKEGYIWLGTKEGLNRFDGYGFQSFEVDLNDTTTLNGTSIHSFCFDSKGRFWVGTNNGLNLFNPHTFKASRIPTNSKGSGTPSGVVWDIYESKNGTVWFASDKGLYRCDKETGKFAPAKNTSLQNVKIQKIVGDSENNLWLAKAKGGLVFYNTRSEKLIENIHDGAFAKKDIRGLTIGIDKCIWIGTGSGLYQYYPDSGKSIEFNPLLSTYIAHGNTNQVLIDNDGLIWAGSWGGGLHLLSEQEQRFSPYVWNIRDPYSLGDNFVNSIFEDREGAIWVATSGGVSRYDKHRKNFITYRTEVGVPSSLSSNIINNILRDKQGRLWVATKTGGVNLWVENQNGFQHFFSSKNTSNSLLNDRVNRISQGLDDKLWLATSKGVSVFDSKVSSFKNYSPSANTYLSASYIQTVLCDSLGNVWIGTVSGLDRYKGDEAPYFEPIDLFESFGGEQERFLINNIVEDSDHTLWIGTFGKGLLHYDPRTKATTQYIRDKEDNSISNDHIYFVHLEKDAVWIGTNGSGLDRLDRKTKAFRNYSTKDGLSNNVINGILVENKRDYLWLSTNKGICRLNLLTHEIKTYDADFGLQSNLFRRRACWKDTDGRMYFGGLQGLTAFYPEQVSDNPVLPRVHINELQVYDKEGLEDKSFYINMLDSKVATLKHSQNSFIVDFIGLSFSMAKRNGYKYQLVNFDKSWRKAGVRRQAEYTNVPPGEYLFKVQASNNDGLWNEEGDTIKITIKPAWWETYPAILSTIVLLLALLIIAYKWRTNNYKKQKVTLENEVKERTSELFESREELRSQHEELELKSATLSKRTTEMRDSINYASRIQKALLASSEALDKELEDSCVFFQPREKVSGDFYWSGYIGSKFAVVAADCTGHGVPGAFLSMLGTAFLNEVVALNKEMNAAEVLEHLRKRVKNIFRSSTSHMVSDGMDLALCIIDKEKKVLEYAGAYNPLYYVRSNKLEVIKADTMPIGYYVRSQKSFTNHVVNILPGDRFYIFSDGYVDQFGGENGHKFMMKNFRNLILSIHDLPFSEQSEMLKKNIERFRGDYKQVDDMLVMGFKVF